jgi:hypothetical protein
MRALYLSMMLGAACWSGCGSPQKAAAVEQPPEQVPAAASGTCGSKGQPDCPLQRWMKSTLQTYQRAGDYERLARAFGELGAHAPAGYDSWKTQAEHGAQLAAKQDADGIKQVCKDCHQEHRARFRKERREAPAW